MHRRDFLKSVTAAAAGLAAQRSPASERSRTSAPTAAQPAPSAAPHKPAPTPVQTGELSGEPKKWHRVSLTFTGPETAEDAEPNPFRDYRLNVTFIHGDRRYLVPGFYAADGNAAETSATSGNKWRVHFAPDAEGTWHYEASFRTGPDVATSDDPQAGRPAAFDGARGTFDVAPTDKTGRDHRAKGLLRYVGGHYLQFAETGDYYLKGGADSPENFLAYADFDGTFDTEGDFVHRYQPHAEDWQPGDPTWQGEKGRNIVGALNYLAAAGMNSVYMVTYNLDGGDGRDVWVWTAPDVRDRFDASKLDQWEIVFEHMDRLGIQLHFVTQETENDRRLGGSPALNPVRKLYYRELCARFAHHLAVMWNLGEENNTSDDDRKQIAAYIRGLDPYRHPITVHTHNNRAPDFYNGLLGDPHFEATSIQGNMADYHRDAIVLRERSREAGRPWAVFGDEQPPAGRGIEPDDFDPDHDEPRKLALWGNLMGGGSGVEWYFGYGRPHNDLNCEDWRSRAAMWDQTRHALDFFQHLLPFADMQPANDTAAGARDAKVLAQPGRVYAVYLPEGGTADLTVGEGTYSVLWYNPRIAGELQPGSIRSITGPGPRSLGTPPAEPDQDWALLVRRVNA